MAHSAQAAHWRFPGILQGMEASSAVRLSDLSDEALIPCVLADKTCFAELVGRYEQPLMRYLNRLGVRSAEDQEDLLQEIFIKVYRNLNSFDQSLKFSSWIYRIAHNETMSWYRKVRVRPEGYLVADPEELMRLIPAGEPSADAQFDATVDSQLVNDALQALPEKYRTVLILRFFEHKEYEEISDILRIPVGTVGTLVYRGKQRLAALLSEKMDV
jgi:RNA polymerase sigma-70 factor (ECF subfamily)